MVEWEDLRTDIPNARYEFFSGVDAVVTSRPSGMRVIPVQMAKLAMSL